MRKFNRRFVLDPNLSAMANLFNAASHATHVLLFSKRYGRPHFTKEELNELIDEMTLYVVLAVLRKIRSGRYDRKWTFYLNVFSSAMGCRRYMINKKFAEVKKRVDALDIDGTVADGALFAEVIPQEAMCPVVNHYRQYDRYEHKKHTPYKDLISKAAKEKRIKTEYTQYCDDCKGLGVTPVSINKFKERNGF